MLKNFLYFSITAVLMFLVSCGGQGQTTYVYQETPDDHAQWAEEYELYTTYEIEFASENLSEKHFIYYEMAEVCRSDYFEPELPEPTHGGYRWIVPPVFDEVKSFVGGFAAVRLGNRYGVINSYGEVVVPIIYESLNWPYRYYHWLDFSPDFIQVWLGGRTGIVDTAGNVLVPFDFDTIRIHGEYAITSVNPGAHGVRRWEDNIQKLIEIPTGRVVIPAGYFHISRVESGFAQVFIIQDGRHYGLVCTETGEVVVPTEFAGIRLPVVDGLAIARLNRSDVGNFGVINTHGEEIIPFRYGGDPFRNWVTAIIRDGMILISCGDSIAALMDYEGNYLVPRIFSRIWFTEHQNFVIVETDSYTGRSGIWNIEKGEFIVPDEFYDLWTIDENTALARTEPDRAAQRSYVFIDIYENRVISTFTQDFGYGGFLFRGEDFRGGYAVFGVGGEQWGYYFSEGLIDSRGNVVLPPTHNRIRHFSDIMILLDDHPDGAYVGWRRRQGRLYETSTGKEVLPWHDFIGWLNDGIAVINSGGEYVIMTEWIDEITGGYWGFINEAGQVLIPPVLQYERVVVTSGRLAAVQSDGKWGFVYVYAS